MPDVSVASGVPLNVIVSPGPVAELTPVPNWVALPGKVAVVLYQSWKPPVAISAAAYVLVPDVTKDMLVTAEFPRLGVSTASAIAFFVEGMVSVCAPICARPVLLMASAGEESVCVPAAAVVPETAEVALETLVLVRPFTMMVWPAVAPEAISAVIQK